MCTVTILPLPADGGVQLACNRDELRRRPEALPPRVVQLGSRRAIMPIDPVSAGTWIGANDAGLAMTIMNVYPVAVVRDDSTRIDCDVAAGLRSRGQIIPSLLHGSTLGEAVDLARDLDPALYPPFRLVMLDRNRVVEVLAANHRMTISPSIPLDRPMLFTSSGLGDDIVHRPRRELFDELLQPPGDPVAAQHQFHRHRWPDRPHLSVRMSRPDARTFSITTVQIGPASARMIYVPLPPDGVSQSPANAAEPSRRTDSLIILELALAKATTFSVADLARVCTRRSAPIK